MRVYLGYVLPAWVFPRDAPKLDVFSRVAKVGFKQADMVCHRVPLPRAVTSSLKFANGNRDFKKDLTLDTSGHGYEVL